MDKIRLGIIGCGGMGANHQRGMSELSDIAVITATCDIVPELAQQAKEALGAEMCCTDYADMLPYVDAVVCVLPHHLHYECGMFFLRRGKHVLMEKPMCNTENECVNLIRTAEENNLTLMCAYPVPYWPEVVELKRLVDSGEYGAPFQMSVWTEQLTIIKDGGWGATKRNLGGGQFFSHGCHYVDLILRFLGNPVSGTHMGNTIATPWMEGEGTSNMIMKFESGAMAYHMGTWAARGTHHGWDIQIHCRDGMLELDRRAGTIYLYQTALGEENPKVLYTVDNKSKKTQYETRHFLECCLSGEKPLTDGRSALQSLRCIWKMYEAEEKGVIADLRGLGIDQECKL